MAELKVKVHETESWNCVDVVPDGEYTVVVIKSDVRLSRSRKSRRMRLLLKITEGEFSGYRLLDCTYLMHSQPAPVLHGRRKLAALCVATGINALGDSSQFHDIPIRIIVRNRYDRNGKPASEIREWERIEA